MSFTSQEESVEDGQPVELFRFSNDTDIFRWTNGPVEVEFNGEDYLPESIGRTDANRDSIDTERTLVIKADVDNALAIRYLATVPSSPDLLELYRFHSTDSDPPEVVQLFDGAVTHVTFTNNKSNIHVIHSGSVLQKLIPLQTTRNACNHILYDSKCQVVEVNFSMVVTVTAISSDGLTVTVDGSTNTFVDTGLQLSAQLTADSAFLLAGMLNREGVENRMIRVTTNPGGNISAITVNFPFQSGVVVGTPMKITAGCDRAFTTCKAKFANGIRYGGFPFIPNKNPFSVGVKGD